MKFSSGQIVSVVTGVMACEMDEIYLILNYMTGDDLYTHQLPRAATACEEYIKKQCKWADSVDTSTLSPKTYKDWIKKLNDTYGEWHDLEPLPVGIWQKKNPISELIEMRSS